jgi:hypothetical protein
MIVNGHDYTSFPILSESFPTIVSKKCQLFSVSLLRPLVLFYSSLKLIIDVVLFRFKASQDSTYQWIVAPLASPTSFLMDDHWLEDNSLLKTPPLSVGAESVKEKDFFFVKFESLPNQALNFMLQLFNQEMVGGGVAVLL